jgi:alkaline phosphatase D
VELGQQVHLHLADARSWRRRNGKALLGQEQLDAIEAAMVAAGEGATHLLASPTVVERRSGDSWLRCRPEYERLLDLASRHHILVLSGDVHDYNVESFPTPAEGRFLHEATASGAALRRAVLFGSKLRNWGLLDIDDDAVGVRIFDRGAVRLPCTIDRGTWTRQP